MKKQFVIMALTATLLLGVASATTWQTQTSFSGSTIKTTDTFNIPTSEWRITWSFTPNTEYPDTAIFMITVYRSDGDARSDFTGSNTEKSGTQYIHEGPGNYYLSIIAANCDYNLNVEVPGANPTPTPSVPETGIFAVILLLVLTATLAVIKRKR